MELAFILIIGIISRFLFFLGAENSDEYFHLWVIKRLRRVGNLWYDNIDDSIFKGHRGYPSLPHLLISGFSEKSWLLVGRFLNVMYDLVAIAVVYLMAGYLFHTVWQFPSQGMLTPQGIVTLLFATSPILHPVTSRLMAIGGRTLGNLLCIFYFIALASGYLSGNIYLFIACIPLIWLIILSSQFALQFSLFCSISISILYLDPIPISVYIIGLGLGLIVPRLGIRKLLQRKLDHYVWYFRNYKRGTTAGERNKLIDLIKLPVYLWKRPDYFVKVCFKNSSFMILIYSLPPLTILLYWLAVDQTLIDVLLADKYLQFCSYVVFSTLIIFLLTSLRPLLFLGQAERYFEYSAGAVAVLYIYVAMKSFGTDNSVTFWVFAFQMSMIMVLFSVSQYNQILQKSMFSRTDESLSELITYLRGRKLLSILSIPTKWNFKLATYLDNQDTKFYYDNISRHDKIDGIRYMETDHIHLHFVKPDFDYFRDKYGLNTLVVVRGELSEAAKAGIKYDFKNCRKEFENRDYSVYSLTGIE